LLVDGAVGGFEGFAGAFLFEHVVHVGDGEGWEELLLAFAVGVEGFAESANAGALGVGGNGRRRGRC
jgi:hypothetical protein